MTDATTDNSDSFGDFEESPQQQHHQLANDFVVETETNGDDPFAALETPRSDTNAKMDHLSTGDAFDAFDEINKESSVVPNRPLPENSFANANSMEDPLALVDPDLNGHHGHVTSTASPAQQMETIVGGAVDDELLNSAVSPPSGSLVLDDSQWLSTSDQAGYGMDSIRTNNDAMPTAFEATMPLDDPFASLNDNAIQSPNDGLEIGEVMEATSPTKEPRDEFDDFGMSPAPQPDSIALDVVSTDDTVPWSNQDNDGMHSTPPPAEVTLNANDPTTGEFDTFGDMDSTMPIEKSDVDSENVAGSVDNIGEFEAPPTTPNRLDDNGFGDSAAAVTSLQSNLGNDVDAAPLIVAPLTDDFGDFDAIPPTPASDDFGPLDASPVPTAPSTDDCFGDFDAAAPVTTPTSDSHDGMGDFDTAAPVMAIPPTNMPGTDVVDVDMEPVTLLAATEDDFGNFDAAPATAISHDNNLAVDDDEFGDFDVAPTTVSAPDNPMEDDDFGDFDEAPPVELTPNDIVQDDDDDFGDFDEAPASDAPADVATTAPNDPPNAQYSILEHIRLEFPKLFAQYHPTEISGDDDVDNSTLDPPVSPRIQDVLSELSTSTEPIPTDYAIQMLDKLFQDTSLFAEDLTSQRIVSERGNEGPFHHFSFPVGGIHSAGVQPIRPSQSEAPRTIPALLSVQLPPASEEPRTTLKVPRTTTAAALPDAPKESIPQGISEQAKNFLQRIPDLSYMLSSRLSLPTKR